MDTQDHLSTLGKAVAAYLSTLTAISECVAEACPEVGKPYAQRIERHRTRLSFDPHGAQIYESSSAIHAELKEYAASAASVLRRQSRELRQGLLAMDEIVQNFQRRNDYYASQLRQVAAQLEDLAAWDRERLNEVVNAHAANLRQSIESMAREHASLLSSMQREMADVDARLAGELAIDPTTGLSNRKEAERRIATLKTANKDFTLVNFEVLGQATGEVLRQVAVRLASQFRPQDLIARWDDREFMVIFQGPAEVADARVKYIIPWVAGKYDREDGEKVDITLEVRVPQPELARA